MAFEMYEENVVGHGDKAFRGEAIATLKAYPEERLGDVLMRCANTIGAELVHLRNSTLEILIAGVLQKGKW